MFSLLSKEPVSVYQPVCTLLCILFLFIYTLWDLKYLHIPKKLLLSGTALSFCCSLTGLFLGSLRIPAFIVSLALWAVLWLLHRITGQNIGSGDIWALAAMLMYLGPMRGILCLSLSLFLTFWAALLSYLRKKNLKAKLPFLPFLFAGCLLLSLSEVL